MCVSSLSLIIHQSGFAEDLVGIKYWNFICLIISWLVVYAILCKGIASSGKVYIIDVEYDILCFVTS